MRSKILQYQSRHDVRFHKPKVALIVALSPVMFLMGHLIFETIIGYVVEVRLEEARLISPNPERVQMIWRCYSYSIAEKIEIGFSAAVAFLVCVLIAQRVFGLPINPHGIPTALAAGASFCLIRWGLWWLSVTLPSKYSEGTDWLVAIILGGIFSLVEVRLKKDDA